MQELICEIKDLVNREDLFKFKDRKDNVEHYEPLKDITIQSINIDNGYISWNKITDFSVHYNLEMYNIFDPLDRFESFYVSSDHSMIAWNEIEQVIQKVTPLEAKENGENLMMIIYHEDEDDFILIPYNELLIERDETKTTGYDFTVENDFTFSTFDGVFVQDTAAIYMPLSMESQQDCKKMHIPTGMNNSTQLSLEIKHELVLSAYIITDDKKPMKPDYGIVTYKQLREDNMIGIKDNVHCHQTCTLKLPNGKSIKTTLGRALFNSLLPDEFLKKRYNWFLDKQINKKILNGDIIYNLSLEYTMETMADIVTKIANFLRVYTSVYPASLLLDEFMENTAFKALKEKYEKAKTMDEKQAIIGEIESKFKTGISDVMPMIDYIVASGSRGDPSQLRQMLVTKGLIQDAQGNLISINDCYVDGMKPEGAFMDGYGSRKGIMDRSRSTSVTGYLTRKIVYACASVLLDTNLNDCGTKRTVPVKITKDNAMLLYGRYMIDSKGKKILFGPDNQDQYIGKTMDLRSPIYCKSKKLCKTCYGDLAKFYGTPFVGILAANALGERGTQRIMQTFHTAGAVKVAIPDLIEQALDNNPNLTKEQMSKYFKQDGYQLKFNVNQEVELTLRHDEYLDLGMTEFTLDPEKSGIIKDSTIEGTNVQSALDLKPFAGHVQFADGTNLEIILDDEVFVPYEFFETREEGKNAEGVKCIVLKGNSKDIPFLFSTVIASKDLNVVMKTILGIIEKKNIMKYPEVAFNKLSKIYGDGFGVAYNHIEILISQIFRNKMKPEYPARLIEPYVAQVYGIKYISHLEGFLSGMLFENMGKSLQNGFINDTVTHNPMEQLLSDDFDFLREDKED